ncbi:MULTISPECIES: hypothetical protein [Methylobacterium]|uniref:hypothetical protein n=1 Tax=Methylobacterium TaxID=407 RepID=UPI000ED971CA|nr:MULTISPECIES: hypothetical protein [Methylobacterium]GBU18822.1 hypothetical protein AwMethylo_30370 [Methylobacterium sp.]
MHSRQQEQYPEHSAQNEVGWPRGASAGPIGEHLDRIGGCRWPLHESFSQEVSPFTPRPYGKALADWTDADLAEFRDYFLACREQRPDWGRIGPANRGEAVRAIDTAVGELRFKIGMSRDEARGRRAVEDARRRQGEIEGEKRRADAEAAARQAQARQDAETVRRGRDAERARTIKPFIEELQRFTEAADTMPHAELLPRLDGYVARIRVLMKGLGDAPRVATLLQKTAEDFTKLRDQIIEDNKRATASRPQPAPTPETGPYDSFEWLGQQMVSAGENPLRREEFQRSLTRGIDLNAGVARIDRTPNGWMVRLSGRLGSPGSPDQGMFCRVEGTDTASLAILRGVSPPYAIVHVEAPEAEEFLLESEPPTVCIVFGPCRVTPADDGTPRARRPGGSAAAPADGAGSPKADLPPVVPSPADLRCTSRPNRRDGERAMARRLRQAWALPAASAGDPSLRLNFAVTLDFDGRITEPSKLLTADSTQASPEDMQAAVEAAHRAITATAPFPELGRFAGGTMQVEMTPCD